MEELKLVSMVTRMLFTISSLSDFSFSHSSLPSLFHLLLCHIILLIVSGAGCVVVRSETFELVMTEVTVPCVIVMADSPLRALFSFRLIYTQAQPQTNLPL